MATNLLKKINLNGTELIISDTEARNKADSASSSASANASNISTLNTKVTNLESKTNNLVTASYDASSTLTLTSKN